MPHDWDHLHAACAEAAVCQSCGGMLSRSKTSECRLGALCSYLHDLCGQPTPKTHLELFKSLENEEPDSPSCKGGDPGD